MKTWALGICSKYKHMLEADGGTKSAHYYRKVIFNDLVENSAATIAFGEQNLTALETGTAPKTNYLAMFDDV